MCVLNISESESVVGVVGLKTWKTGWAALGVVFGRGFGLFGSIAEIQMVCMLSNNSHPRKIKSFEN